MNRIRLGIAPTVSSEVKAKRVHYGKLTDDNLAQLLAAADGRGTVANTDV